MRVVGLGLLLAAGALGWLSFGDRSSALALNIVEWDSRLGVPVAAIVGALGLLLVVLGGGRSRSSAPPPPARAAVNVQGKAPRPSTPGSTPASAPGPSRADEGWLAALQGRAGELNLEAGARLLIEPGRTPPVQLLLDRVTPERARRTIEVYAEFLSTIPTPPRASVEFRSSPHAGPPRTTLVNAALRRYFPGESFAVTAHEDTIEVVFQAPDGRWRERVAAS